jgi:RNA polymerase sigma factor (sigma-70 family)
LIESLSETWHRVLNSDPDAWEELVEQYGALVYSIALRHGLSRSDAADCSQLTWMSLYKGRRTVRDATKLPSWLFGTASRIARRMYRQDCSRSRREETVAPPAPTIAPDVNIIRLQRRAVLEFALGELNVRCETLLRALFFSDRDLSYSDIAQQLKIPFNSLGPTRKRCIDKLRKILENFDDF